MNDYNFNNRFPIHDEHIFEDVKKSIGDKLKMLRDERNFIQQKLANIFNLFKNHLAQVEIGRT